MVRGWLLSWFQDGRAIASNKQSLYPTSGQDTPVHVKRNAPIKAELQKALHYRLGHHKLSFNGKPVSDSDTFFSLGIPSGGHLVLEDVPHVVVRLPNGGRMRLSVSAIKFRYPECPVAPACFTLFLLRPATEYRRRSRHRFWFEVENCSGSGTQFSIRRSNFSVLQ